MRELPVEAKIVEPANLGTADCDFFCFCDDGCDYAVKGRARGRYIPHSEWFCKHLGDAVGIPSPECRLVNVRGEVCFGSRWESGHDPNDWPDRLRQNRIERDRVIPTLSRIFAFDLFVNNIDRHTNNYIVRYQRSGWSFLAFDHSRAWMSSGWPLPEPPMNENYATRRVMKFLNLFLGGTVDQAQMELLLERILSVKVDRIEDIMNCQHPDWLNVSDKDAILTFWSGDALRVRIEKIREGLKRGMYL